MLLVDNDENNNLVLGSRNLPGVKLVSTKEVSVYDSAGPCRSADVGERRQETFGGARKMTIYEVIKRPIVTEKGVAKKEAEHTLSFEVAPRCQQGAGKGRCRAVVQGEGGRRSHLQRSGQAAPSRPFRRLPVGLEESLRDIEGGREDARVRRDLTENIPHADEDRTIRRRHPAAS